MQYMGPWIPSFTNAISSHLDSSPFVTFSFATVDKSGFPKVRTCIYRGFLFNDKKTNILTFTTDIRMDKYEHLSSNPKFEAVFWFPATNEQFRLSGDAKVLTYNNTESFSQSLSNYPIVSPNAIKRYSSSLDLSNIHNTLQHQQSVSDIHAKPTSDEWEGELNSKWEQLSGNLKSSFRKPEPGSSMSSDKQKLLDSISRGVDGSNADDGKKNFSLVLMLVDKCDYINLNGRQSRYQYERFDDDQWTEDEICP
ncbi:hypothetical protein WICMUC_000345 [Wickerhamomyces mucosus]|uniref:Pyridoxamine 5'-phosphate oxidase Alr4036 family FMN-binding domain-containing protein n=1 Tax=Wickerhamomyces mucosus TaxID=1378264 RepID=A0A9P8Q064_9ASCO|nr:hypothetical protein WICMUC_000345 [Wickerhamomyces mucosus]